ncbi:hypothetical protein C8T65DRAFT_727341 [Cerioporus squamosus]|nr:hypothetical protein C8T65DRAFT_727341 [Cerioporus squamosus]
MGSGYLSSSPPSSPSLAPIDSSPPSSPSLTALCTPPGSPGPVHPFAGSTKSTRRPRIYERHSSDRPAARTYAYDEDDDALARQGDRLTDTVTPTRRARVIDPFSASAKDTWRPPTYEKKVKCATPDRSTTSSYAYASRPVHSPTPKHRAPAMDLDVPDDFFLTDDEHERPIPSRITATRRETEHEKWDRVISNAIDKQNVVIDLSRLATSFTEAPMTFIPPQRIAELQNLVILPSGNAPSSAPPSPTLSPALAPTTSFAPSRAFNRATTMPAGGFTQEFFTSKDGEVLRGTPAARAASMQTVTQQPSSQLSRHEIEMYLANHAITRLPAELFRVSALAVLSLRSNGLTHLPPQIAQLTALRELNIAQNKLRWLPAEMLGMRLGKLAVAGNPWMPPPPALPQDPSNTRLARTPILAYPLPPTHTHLTTFLEARHSIPITADYAISPNISSVLRVCAPAAIAQPAEDRLPKHKKARHEHHDKPGSLHSAHSDSDRSHNDDDVDEEDIFAPRSRSRASDEEDEITGISVCPSPRHRAADGRSWLEGRVPVFVRHAEERWTWQAEIAGVRVGAEGVGVPPPEESQPQPPRDGGKLGQVRMEDLSFEGGLADPADFDEAF